MTESNPLEELANIKDSTDRYRFLIKLGRNLSDMPNDHKVEKYKVEGCISNAWLYPSFKDGKVEFEADSEAAIVKGIIALMVHFYSRKDPDFILSHEPSFLTELGIHEHLSMNRRNGLANIIKQIKMYAFVYKNMQQ